MTESRFLLAGAVGCAVALAAAAPAILDGVSGGLWEVTGAGPAVKVCVADAQRLAAYQHRGSNCSTTLVRGDPLNAVVSYTCSGGGFGQSSISLVTPRSLHVETQGISSGSPYKYAFDAHRLGDCHRH